MCFANFFLAHSVRACEWPFHDDVHLWRTSFCARENRLLIKEKRIQLVLHKPRDSSSRSYFPRDFSVESCKVNISRPQPIITIIIPNDRHGRLRIMDKQWSAGDESAQCRFASARACIIIKFLRSDTKQNPEVYFWTFPTLTDDVLDMLLDVLFNLYTQPTSFFLIDVSSAWLKQIFQTPFAYSSTVMSSSFLLFLED